jgi:hypothetical protein
MISSASSMRAICSPAEGQSIPQGDSLSASPEPTPRNARPGQSSSTVATNWATVAGWCRNTGAVTPVPSAIRPVALPIAPSSVQACPDSPGSHQGWKWSLTLRPSKPARSAATACGTSALGANCSVAS